MMLNKVKIKTKLITAFILVSLAPLILVSVITMDRAAQGLEDELAAKFTAIQETKRNHIKDYFSRLRTSVSVIKDDPYLQETMKVLNDAYSENHNLRENATWETMVQFKETPIKAMAEKNGFYDLLLISAEGNIIYTAGKEADLGMDVKRVGLGDAFEKAAKC